MATGQRAISYSWTIILRIVDIIVGVIELLLGLRLILRFLGANAGSPFVTWLYSTTDQLLAPFAGIFPTITFQGTYVIEFTTLFAMIAYAFIGWAISVLISFLGDSVLRLDTSI